MYTPLAGNTVIDRSNIRQHVLGHAVDVASTRQRELNHTDHTDHTGHTYRTHHERVGW